MVKVLPEPVTPEQASGSGRPGAGPSTSLAIASGWSPWGVVVGLKTERRSRPRPPLAAARAGKAWGS